MIDILTESAAPSEGPLGVDLFLADETTAEDDTTEVSQVEDVVRLGGRRQQVLHRSLVDLHGRRHYYVAHGKVVRRKLLALK